MKISLMLAAITPLRMCSRIGLPCTWSMGLGTSFVSSFMRMPLPAARMTAFIWVILIVISTPNFVGAEVTRLKLLLRQACRGQSIVTSALQDYDHDHDYENRNEPTTIYSDYGLCGDLKRTGSNWRSASR